jgi:very-short-patch-repair endonuclease
MLAENASPVSEKSAVISPPRRLTLESVSQKLKIKKISLVDSLFLGLKIKHNFQCLACHYQWTTRLDEVLYKSGCLKCSGSMRKTKDEINDILKPRFIVALEQHKNNQDKINFQCIKENCGFVWKSCVDKIVNAKHGCHKCANHLNRTKEEINELLQSRSIELIDNHQKTNERRWFKCHQCQHVWKTLVANVLFQTGCPACKNKNEKLFKQELYTNNLKFNYQVKLSDLDTSTDKKYVVDFYLPEFNTIIEYNGKQHYQPVKFNNISDELAMKNFQQQQIRDEFVKSWCDNNNIKLIQVDGRYIFNNKIKDYVAKLGNQLSGNE